MKMLRYTLILFIYIAVSRCAYAQHLLQKTYQPSFPEGKIKSFFKDIHKKAGVEIAYSESVLDNKQKVKLKGTEHTVEQVLITILQGLPVKWIERTDKILLVPSSGTNAAPERVENITLSGFIKDSSSSEVLIGATVYLPATGAGTFTNAYGFYSLTVPAGQYDMVVSYIGYSKKILSTHGGNRDIQLSVDDGMEEVSVTVKKEQPSDHVHLSVQGINKYAAPLGDNDVMRALQHYPGVQPSNDGTITMNVRGGDPSQNLCMLDGVPLYYIDHVISISSMYNTEALKTTDFYTGAFPSRYGGRLSSVIDIYTKDGDMEHYGGSAKIGLLNGNISLEGPLIKNKASMIISARRSWADLVQKVLDTTDVNLDFYDINAKVNYQLNASNRFYISVYKGRDHLGFGDEKDQQSISARMKWGNAFVAARWNTVLNPKVFINTTATYSDFRYELRLPDFSVPDSAEIVPNSKGVSTITEKAIKSQLSWYLSTAHKLEMGLQYAHATFSPATLTFADGNQSNINKLAPAEQFSSNELVAYIEEDWKPTSRLKVRLGLHMAYWLNKDFSYPVLQPRLHISYKVTSAVTLYGAATRMAQFLHMLDNNVFGIPSEFWLPSTANIKPESSLLGNIGIKVQTDNGFNFSVEGYYKTQYNLAMYNGVSNVFDNAREWESKLTQGSGKSYGLECSIGKQFGDISASLVYTLSRTTRQFDDLFGGIVIPYKYDRRHNLHLDGVWQISKAINFSASWTFMSGSYITLPDQVYPDPDNNILNNTWNYAGVNNYTTLNNYRLPTIHRLDMVVNFTKKKGLRYERTITLGIFNAYGRRNILSAFLEEDADTETYKLSTFSIGRFVPAISYRIQF